MQCGSKPLDQGAVGRKPVPKMRPVNRTREREPGMDYKPIEKQEIWKELLLVFGSLVFALLSAEGGMRLFPNLRPSPRTYVGEYGNRQTTHNLIADPELGWKLRSYGRSEANAQGFRGPSDFHPRQGCNGIAFAGDSMTYGIGVSFEKTFASLTQAGVPGSCVYNMGVPGFGLDQIWLTVHTQALPLHPRVVVVTLICDDLSRSEEAYRSTEGFNKPTFKLVDGRLVPETAADRPNSIIRFLQLWFAKIPICFRIRQINCGASSCENC